MCDCTGAPKASENEKDAEESAVDKHLMCVMFLFDFFFFFFCNSTPRSKINKKKYTVSKLY